MSMHLEFEPHAWYMGFAIQKTGTHKNDITNYPFIGYIENGMHYQIDKRHASSLKTLKEQIREYHLCQHNGYGERIARRRLEELRAELQAERISYGELAELWKLHEYIDAGDVELLEAAGVPEGTK